MNIFQRQFIKDNKWFFLMFATTFIAIMLLSIFSDRCRVEDFRGHQYNVCVDNRGYEFREHSMECEHPSCNSNTTGIGGQN